MKSTQRRIVIVGAGYAGILCAARLSRRLSRNAGAASIVLVNPEAHFVDRIRLHEDAATGKPRRRLPLEHMLRGMAVELQTGAVREIDLVDRRLRLESAGSRTTSSAFDDLVLATGSVRAAEDVPGVTKHTHSIATEDGALALAAALDRLSQRARVTVCGGGLTGIELATELAERRGLRVTLVTASEVGPSLSEPARAHVRASCERLGITLRERTQIVAVEEGGLILADGSTITSDVVAWCVGFRATSLARESGLTVDSSGRVLVDERLRSARYPFIHVIGDAARVDSALADGGTRPLRMACATASPMGAFCADDICRELAGSAPQPFRFAYALQCVSLGRRDGVVQRVDGEDRARPSVLLRRRPAAWFKEALCRFAAGASAIERMGLPYVWPQRALVLPSREIVRQ